MAQAFRGEGRREAGQVEQASAQCDAPAEAYHQIPFLRVGDERCAAAIGRTALQLNPLESVADALVPHWRSGHDKHLLELLWRFEGDGVVVILPGADQPCDAVVGGESATTGEGGCRRCQG